MNRKDEEEHEMRNRMRMLNFGELGESMLVKVCLDTRPIDTEVFRI
jgi:hypothetical protein